MKRGGKRNEEAVIQDSTATMSGAEAATSSDEKLDELAKLVKSFL